MDRPAFHAAGLRRTDPVGRDGRPGRGRRFHGVRLPRGAMGLVRKTELPDHLHAAARDGDARGRDEDRLAGQRVPRLSRPPASCEGDPRVGPPGRDVGRNLFDEQMGDAGGGAAGGLGLLDHDSMRRREHDPVFRAGRLKNLARAAPATSARGPSEDLGRERRAGRPRHQGSPGIHGRGHRRHQARHCALPCGSQRDGDLQRDGPRQAGGPGYFSAEPGLVAVLQQQDHPDRLLAEEVPDRRGAGPGDTVGAGLHSGAARRPRSAHPRRSPRTDGRSRLHTEQPEKADREGRGHGGHPRIPHAASGLRRHRVLARHLRRVPVEDRETGPCPFRCDALEDARHHQPGREGCLCGGGGGLLRPGLGHTARSGLFL